MKKYKKRIYIFLIISILIFLNYIIYTYISIRFDINKVINYNPSLTTQFFDKNDKLIANIFDKENRLYVSYKDIPTKVIESLIAIEDTKFFEHNGININAITRASIKVIKARKLVEGASTITQQLIKIMVLSRQKKFSRKVKEILLALRLETILSKEEILERYLNEIYFGHGYYGIKTASQGYFRKELYQLNLKEIAMLVGLPKAPSFYDPTIRYNFAVQRANQVINRLNNLGWITKQTYEYAINYNPTIYDDTLTKNKAPYVIDYAIKLLNKDISDIKTGGYKVNLTIDLKTQEIARKSLQYGYDKIIKRDNDINKSYTKTLNGGIITIENHTGKILAMLGGVDYKKSSFNRAVQSQRQPGSSIKPFLYQVALDSGYSTISNLVDISRSYDYQKDNETKIWKPQNYGNKYKGLIKLKNALIKSRNLATINLVTDIGIDIMYKKLKLFGIENIPYDLSMTLGSFSISILKLSEAYTIFSNNGIKVKPYLIKDIINRNEDSISFIKEDKYIISKEQSFLMTSILQDVVKKGTGRNARVNNIQIAGKTGTTNNNVDAWFCGYSPTIQTIIWYGNDDNKPMQKTETGGRSSGTAFSYFYKEYLKIYPETKRKFNKPTNLKEIVINGKKEYFTKQSPIENINNKLKDNNIIF
jgi:penicillin-binding protein 1A